MLTWFFFIIVLGALAAWRAPEMASRIIRRLWWITLGAYVASQGMAYALFFYNEPLYRGLLPFLVYGFAGPFVVASCWLIGCSSFLLIKEIRSRYALRARPAQTPG